MILDGPSIKEQLKATNNQAIASLHVRHLIQYNCHKNKRVTFNANYHREDNDIPLPVCIGLKIHGSIRNRVLVDTFFRLGLYISCDRVLAISTPVANSVYLCLRRNKQCSRQYCVKLSLQSVPWIT